MDLIFHRTDENGPDGLAAWEATEDAVKAAGCGFILLDPCDPEDCGVFILTGVTGPWESIIAPAGWKCRPYIGPTVTFDVADVA